MACLLAGRILGLLLWLAIYCKFDPECPVVGGLNGRLVPVTFTPGPRPQIYLVYGHMCNLFTVTYTPGHTHV